MVYRFSGYNDILLSKKSVLYFLLFGVILGPLVIAVFGVGGLFLFHHISASEFQQIFSTWWLGDSTGAILFTPFLLVWLTPEENFNYKSYVALIFSFLSSVLIAAVLLDFLPIHQYLAYGSLLLIPILFALMFRHGQRLVFTIQISILFLAVYVTSLGIGPFIAESQLGSLIQLQIFAGALSLILFVINLFNLEISRREESLQKRTIELEQLYRKDALTNLWNRYRIQEFLELELNRFKRDKRPFGLLLMDIDNFKLVNDNHGHLAGDQILIELSTLLLNHIREVDFLGRWGGEEFILIVNDTSLESLTILANKLNMLVAEYDFPKPKRLTISIGVALSVEEDTELTLMDRADVGLYKAKQNGKNQAIFQSIKPK